MMIDDFQVMPGIQLDSVRTFRRPHDADIHITPIIVDFRSLLLSKTGEEIIKGVSNHELLHAVVALYDVSLSEMTPDTLYASVCEKWARTILLIKDVNETIHEMESRRTQKNSKKGSQLQACEYDCVTAEPCLVSDKDIHSEEDKYVVAEVKSSIFKGVFSDCEDDCDTKETVDDDGDDADEEDFSHGLYTFLQRVHDSRWHHQQQTQLLTADSVHIENRLVAAATFEKSYVKPCDRVVHLTLIAVRRRYRKCKIGEYLLSRVKDMCVVGKYDAVVVHADNSALNFFRKFGFSDDVVLNSRWHDLAEQYTQCTLMSFLPPFTADSGSTLAVAELDIAMMDSELQRWRQKSIDAYRAEVSCVNRLRHEIVTLRNLVSSQQQMISTLTASCEQLQQEKCLIEKEFLDYRLASSKLALAAANVSSDSDCEETGEQLLSQLQKCSTRTIATASAVDDADVDTVTRAFVFAVETEFSSTLAHCSIVSAHKASLPLDIESAVQQRLSRMHEPSVVARLYLCHSLVHGNDWCTHVKQLRHIMDNGFTISDMCTTDYGKALFFSKRPCIEPCTVNGVGHVLLAEVGLGSVLSVLNKDCLQSTSRATHDSIIVMSKGSNDHHPSRKEHYLVFDVHQAKPLLLIEYSCTTQC